MREQWRLLLKPSGASPTPFLSSYHSTDKQMFAQGAPSPGVLVGQASNSSEPASQGGSMPDINPPAAMTNPMNYMDELLSQPNVAMTDFFGLSLGQSENQPQLNPAAFPTGQSLDEDALRQRALAMATQPPKDDNLPPYLWSDPFTNINAKMDDAMGDAGDFMGENFNWQDWSQSIRGLEMESTQTPPNQQQRF